MKKPRTPLPRNLPEQEWPTLLSAEDLADLFGWSKRGAQRRIAGHQLGPYRELGGRHYIHKNDLLAALDRCTVNPPKK